MSQRARDGRTPISPDKDLFHTLNDSYPAIWSNLVQFDFQQKHPGLFKDSPLHRESSTKRLHRGVAKCCATGGVYACTGGGYASHRG